MQRLTFCLLAILCWSCNTRRQADLIIHHAVIYTVNEQFSQAQALAVKDGKIIALGTDREILDQYTAADIRDADGHFIYPGFIDAHTHFLGYSIGLQ
ncbi:MAG TPA: amidohydrolase, partial [Chitinophaga sp.]